MLFKVQRLYPLINNCRLNEVLVLNKRLKISPTTERRPKTMIRGDILRAGKRVLFFLEHLALFSLSSRNMGGKSMIKEGHG